MAPINRNSISLYEDAKATFLSLLQQMAQVGAGLIIMLLLTGGNPPGFIMGLSFCLGVGFVAWSEKNKLEGLTIFTRKQKVKIKQLTTNSNVIIKNSIILSKAKVLRISKSISISIENLTKLISVDLDLKEDLARSKLKSVDLRGVDLEVAYLERTNLSSADLRNITVNNTHFSDDHGISEVTLQNLIAGSMIFDDLLGNYSTTVKIRQ